MAYTVDCTLNGINSFNNGWASSSWMSESTTITGNAGYGKFLGYSGNYGYRGMVFKFTTPNFDTYITSKMGSSYKFSGDVSINISVSLYRTSTGSDNWHAAFSTSPPSFSDTSGIQKPNAMANWNSIQTKASYEYKTFNTATFSDYFKSSTTYYMWLWSDTPTGNSTVGYYSHNSSGVGAPKIKITATIDGVMAADYKKATGVHLYNNYGYYGNGNTDNSTNTGKAAIGITKDTTYPYCYVSSSSTGNFYKKTLTTSGNVQYFYVDKDMTSTSKTFYIVRSKTDLGSPISAPSTSYQASFACPRFACSVYCHSDTATKFTGNSGTFKPTYGSTTLKGLTTSSSSTTVSYSASSNAISWDTHGKNINGKTLYGIYTESKTVKYYKGGSTERSFTSTRTLYGTSSNTSFTYWSDYAVCDSNSEATCIGFASSASATTAEYTGVVSAIADCDTIYGLYRETDTMTYYKGSSTAYTTNPTRTIYGTGQTTDWVINQQIDKTCDSDSSYEFIGWNVYGNNSGWYSGYLSTCFNAGYTTVYARYQKSFSKELSGQLYLVQNEMNWSYFAKGVKYLYGRGSTEDTYEEEYVDPSIDLILNEYDGPYSNCQVIDFDSWLYYDTDGKECKVSKANFDKIGRYINNGDSLYVGYMLTNPYKFYADNTLILDTTVFILANYLHGSECMLFDTLPTIPTKPNWISVNWGYPIWTESEDGFLRINVGDIPSDFIQRAVYIPDNHIRFGNSSWKNVMVYRGVNGEWKPVVIRFGINNTWK